MKTERYSLKKMLIYVGEKSWLQEHVWKTYHKASLDRGANLRWVEPFAGSCCLPLFIAPDYCWVNDSNFHLINFYRQIVKAGKVDDLWSDCPSDPDKANEWYLRYRSRFNEKIRNGEFNDKEAANLFYLLNRAGYGGLSRYNSKGEFNVPFRGHVSNPKTDFSEEQELMRDWKITCLDYNQVLYDLVGNDCENDFIFVDPPYDNTFNSYTSKGFSFSEQVNLAENLAKLPNPIMATNSITDRIVELYTDLGFEVSYRTSGNNLQRPKVKNGVHKRLKEAVFTKNIKVD